MKFAVLAFAALASVASAQTYPDCNVLPLIQIVGGANGSKCAKDSTYSATSGAFPTDEQFKVLCFNDACSDYRAQLKAAEPKECVIKGVFTQDTLLYGKLITPIEEECKKRRDQASPAPTTAAPGPTTAAPGPTTAPGPTSAPVVTPAPAC